MVLSDKPVRIPIRQIGADDARARHAVGETRTMDEAHSVGGAHTTGGAEDAVRAKPASQTKAAQAEFDWKDRALRLQAEMQTYRQRQQRWAEEQVVEEKSALLLSFLEVVDNLEQALKHLSAGDPTHQGVQLAYDALLRMLMREGVERVFAQGRPFDPDVHEAVAVVPAPPRQREDMRVVEVTQPGYRYKDRVLRPAKVIVAK